MNSSCAMRRIVAIGVVLGATLLGERALAAFGRTAGKFAVAPSGAATYSIPIFAPRGPNGLQPRLALVYNSQAGNGYLGVGWSLSGLSSIYRCNLTYAQDAAPAAVSLSTGDGYCLDGQRLRLVTGSYGMAGSTYQTEVANFSNVTAVGTVGNGPASFTVQTANGWTYEYGVSGNSGVLASGTSTLSMWMLDKVTDRAGNTLTFSYETLTGTVVPQTISWTPTSYGASQYSYTLQFNYTTNAVATAGYVAGTPVQNPDLLTSIVLNDGGSQIKEYVLTYQLSGTTGRDRLAEVQECSTSTSECLNPTTITYQSGSAGVSTSATTVVSSPLPTTWFAFAAQYDFNGDGYTDLIYKLGSTWYVAFGSASGYGTPVSTGLTGTLSDNLLFGDLLGTGKDGILADNGGTWYYYTWNGSAFVGTSTGLAFDTTATQFALADINGDGLPDLITLYGPSSVTVKTRLNTSSGSTPSFSGSTVTAFTGGSVIFAGLITPDAQPGNLRSFDFNGDGLQDLAIQEYSCAYYYMGACLAYVNAVSELLSQPGGTFSAVEVGETNQSTILGYLSFANVNDDACTDVIFDQQYVQIAACNGSAAAQLTAAYPIVAVMDWNGDGLTDLIENDNGALYVQTSTATGFAAATATSLSYTSHCTYVALDANGDGLDDLGCVSITSGTNGFEYYAHNGAGSPPDLMSSVTDGYGNSASPLYVPITQGHYTNYTDATYPYQNWVRPMYVTQQVNFSDPTNPPNGTYYKEYWYAGAWKNLQGRGLTGFANVQQYDSRSGIWETSGYERAFPQTGLPTEDVRAMNSAESELISSVTDTPATTTLSSTQYQERYFPYVSASTIERYQVTGNTTGPLIETDSMSYTQPLHKTG